MQYEFKVVEIVMYEIKGLKTKMTTTEDIESQIAKYGLLGWNLISTSILGQHKTYFYFSRPMKALEEMV